MSSVLRKRRRASSQDDLFRIKTAAGDPIPAKSLLVRTFSTCAEQLPAGAEEWDVSGFMYDSEPFSREAVNAWLNCGFCMVFGKAELSTEDQALLSTAMGLHHVLAFAHAVDSPEGLLNAACSNLRELTIEVHVSGRTFELPVCPAHDCAYKLMSDQENDGHQLVADTIVERNMIVNALTSEQRQDIKQQVALQTAGLLEVAHALHLQPLLDALHRFIRLSTWSGASLLNGVLTDVFRDPVLQAALGSSTVSKEAYISSVLTQPCSLVDSPLSLQGLLQPTGEFQLDDESGSVTVCAQLRREFAGARAGQSVTVTLDLFAEDGLCLGFQVSEDSEYMMWFPACLLLGNSTRDGQLSLSI